MHPVGPDSLTRPSLWATLLPDARPVAVCVAGGAILVNKGAPTMVRFISAWLIMALTAASSCGSVYYVDQAHPSASDANPGGESLPWRTLTKAANTVTAGDTVTVKAGTYAEQATLLAPHGGQPGQMVTFRASAGDRVIVDGGGTRTFGFRLGVSYARVEGFEVAHVTGHGILVGWSDGSSLGVEIVNNTVHDCGNNPDTAAVYYAGGGGGFIQGNHLHHNAGDGITFVGITDGLTIRNNLIEHNQVDGMKGGGGGTILIEGNTIHDMTNGVNHGDGMQLMGMTGTLVVRNNTVWDCTQDIYCDDYSAPAGTQPWGDVYIYNNVVYNTQPGANGLGGYWNGIVTGTRYNSWRSLTIVGNTLVNCNDGSGGVSVGVVGSTPGRIGAVKVFNNLFYNSINGTQVTALRAQGGTVEMDYNLYYNQWRTWYLEGWVGLAQFRFNHPDCEQHGFYATGGVAFVNYALVNPDLHLAAGSAAINAGRAVPAAGAVSFSADLDGTPRPQGAAWDIGAYEYYTPTISQWTVVAAHGALGQLAAVAGENYVEARDGGVTQVRLTLAAPLDPATVSPSALSIVGQAGGDQAGRISGVTLTQGDTVLVVQLSSPLPDGERYTLTVSDTVKLAGGGAILGSRVRRLSALAGDADASGAVTAADLLAVRSCAGLTVTGATARYDLDGSGTITGADLIAVRERLGHVLPAAP